MIRFLKRKALPLLLSAALVMSMNGIPVYAVGGTGQTETDLCEHHPEHTADCGYVEAAEGQPRATAFKKMEEHDKIEAWE